MKQYLLGVLASFIFNEKIENGMVYISDNSIAKLFPEENFCVVDNKLFYPITQKVIDMILSEDREKIVVDIDNEFIKAVVKYSSHVDVDDEMVSYLYIYSNSLSFLEKLYLFLKEEWNITPKFDKNELVFDSENTTKLYIKLI